MSALGSALFSLKQTHVMVTFDIFWHTTKGQVMEAVYLGDTRNIDPALPIDTSRSLDYDTFYYVMDFKDGWAGKLTNLIAKARENDVQLVWHF